MPPAAKLYDGFLPGPHIIEGFGQGGFRFAEMSHRGSLLALPTGLHAIEAPVPFEHAFSLYERVLAEAAGIDILLLGTGTAPVPLPAALRSRLREAGISADAMSTASACSTYNVLLSERRRVAALLIAVE